MDVYMQAAEEARSATAEQFDLALEAQQIFNVKFCIDQHLATIAASLPEKDRLVYVEQITSTTQRGEGVADVCRRWVIDRVRTESAEQVKATKLDDKYSHNDVGNGERFAEQHHEKFKYANDRKVWLMWDDKRWRDATETEITHAAKRTAKKLLAEALKSDNKEDYSHALNSLSRKSLSNMIACASSEKVFGSNMKKFDRNPDLLTVDNGTVDLSTGRLYPHAREDMLTTLTQIKYDPQATCPRWEQFLYEIFNGDLELISFVQRAVGYSMTGHTREHAFFILFGGGRNGKGRFIKQLMALLGDAARTTRFQTFTISREAEGGNTPALAALAGGRLVSAGEPDEGVRLSESVIKMLTGEDEITVCRKHEHPFSYIPLYKIWLHTNHKPAIRGTDEGIWSRPRLIPFNVTFKTEKEAAAAKVSEGGIRKDPDRKLDAKLNAERSGILAWAVRGAMEWYMHGLGSSVTVERATESYRAESDKLGPFLEECVRSDPGKFTTNDKICEAYSSWCRRNLVDYEMSGQTLSKQLVSRGYVKGKNEKDVRGFKDISIVSPGGLLAVVPGTPVRNGVAR